MARHQRPPWWRRLSPPRAVAIAAAVLSAVTVAALAVSPSPDLPARADRLAPPTAHSDATRGPRYAPAPIPTIGPPDVWTPPEDRTSAAPPPTTSAPQERPAPRTTTRPPASAAPTTTPPAPPPPAAPGGPVTPAPGATAGLLELVNRDRAAAGCGPVAVNPDLQRQAERHAVAQASADGMYHSNGPTGFDTWGENVAYGYDTSAAVHDGWMGSPGHRENVLDCDFTLIGFGAADSADGTRYWTEQFAA